MSFYDDEFFEEEEDTYALFDDPEELSEFEGDEPSEEFLMANPPPEVHLVEYFFDALHAWCGKNAYQISLAIQQSARRFNITGLAGSAVEPYIERKMFGKDIFVLNPGLLMIMYHMQENTLINKEVLEGVGDVRGLPLGSGSVYDYAKSVWGDYDRDPAYHRGEYQLEALDLPLLTEDPSMLSENNYAKLDGLVDYYIPKLLQGLLSVLPSDDLVAHIQKAGLAHVQRHGGRMGDYVYSGDFAAEINDEIKYVIDVIVDMTQEKISERSVYESQMLQSEIE